MSETYKGTAVLVFLVSMILTLSWVRGEDARGRWSSSNGYVYQVSTEGETLSLSVTGPDGEAVQGRGFWVTEGESFAYQVHGLSGNAYAVYKREHDALEVQGPHGTSWLRRVESKLEDSEF